MSIVNALDNATKKCIGENGNVQYTWSNNYKEQLTQFYFQLVRTKDTSNLEQILDGMLNEFKAMEITKFKNFQTLMKFERELTNLYKLIGHTRDVVKGKGEYSLAYMQVWTWFKHFPDLAIRAFDTFFYLNDSKEQPYGSWKDVKYFCEYVMKREDNALGKKHPLIRHAVELIAYQILEDVKAQDKKITLAAKWCPREKGRFAWVYREVVKVLLHEYYDTAKLSDDKQVHIRAHKKACTILRKRLSQLNKKINTTQIKMCAKDWNSINFDTVTSITANKLRKAFLNVDKQGNIRSSEEDRINCSRSFREYIHRHMTEKGNVKGKRLNTYELVKSALDANGIYEQCLINCQWEDNSKQNQGLKNMVAMADTSDSMSSDNCVPLYNSIGLAIRVAELAQEPFKNRVMTFSATPEWVKFDDNATFVEKVHTMKKALWGMNTNFYSALRMILDSAVEMNLQPNDLANMTLVVFSDMQIDQASTENMETMMTNIEKMYENAGLSTIWKKPFQVPHILFWNLRCTNGFPTLSTHKNVSMLSGYSASLLNTLCNKGIEELKNYTPFQMINDILSNDRYKTLERHIIEKFYT